MQEVLQFLMDLSVNNNRDWFQENKAYYLKAKESFDAFIDEVIIGLKEIDDSINVESSKKCVYRIYRDARFSKNKLPYKNNFGAFIAKNGRKSGYAGYYLHMEPDNSFLGGGIYMPESKALKSIRTDIYTNTEAYKSIIHAADFKQHFGEVAGAKLKRGPKGFPKDFEDIELIKNKHYSVWEKQGDDFWSGADIKGAVLNVFEAQVPFNAFLNTAIDKSKVEEEDEDGTQGLDAFFL